MGHDVFNKYIWVSNNCLLEYDNPIASQHLRYFLDDADIIATFNTISQLYPNKTESILHRIILDTIWSFVANRSNDWSTRKRMFWKYTRTIKRKVLKLRNGSVITLDHILSIIYCFSELERINDNFNINRAILSDNYCIDVNGYYHRSHAFKYFKMLDQALEAIDKAIAIDPQIRYKLTRIKLLVILDDRNAFDELRCLCDEVYLPSNIRYLLDYAYLTKSLLPVDSTKAIHCFLSHYLLNLARDIEFKNDFHAYHQKHKIITDTGECIKLTKALEGQIGAELGECINDCKNLILLVRLLLNF